MKSNTGTKTAENRMKDYLWFRSKQNAPKIGDSIMMANLKDGTERQATVTRSELVESKKRFVATLGRQVIMHKFEFTAILKGEQ
jgi:hypothetical protein